ncbi:hypothetical protein NEUTE2DRAFT_88132 [Neurospora tetrasperma FGSC 2509]|nr:hypothetical protein NEUTE2DRAFT_88132 [Neurospora tetrasperma FGSC 2509]
MGTDIWTIQSYLVQTRLQRYDIVSKRKIHIVIQISTSCMNAIRVQSLHRPIRQSIHPSQPVTSTLFMI